MRLMGTVGVPRTADGDAFRFRSRRWSLDLCSTLLWRRRTGIGGCVEQLRCPDDLSRWLVEAGLCEKPVPVTERHVLDAHSLRESVYRLLDAHVGGRALSTADVDHVNRVAAHSGRFPQLTRTREVRWSAAEPVTAAFAAIACDGIELLSGPWAGRVRECAASDCAFLFVDTSRPGTRKWCAQNRCGNREHVREHRARRMTSKAGGE
jgi:predicted RNA-binding Zn ribbon-like protein